jgi:hypothetical protein
MTAMRATIPAVAVLGVCLMATLGAQARRPPARPAVPAPRAAAPLPPPIKEAPQMTCPAPLGVGVVTRTVFCDVLTAPTPAEGVLITLPPHAGPVTLTFNLHNRHTYSDEQVKANRAYARYTATIGVLTLDNTLISRAVVDNEFRNANDLVDRIGGGAGPGGVKAVAPTGSEAIAITIPEEANQVSILGEKLTQERLDGGPTTYSSAGRPIAIISNVMIEYRPPPPKPPVRKRR